MGYPCCVYTFASWWRLLGMVPDTVGRCWDAGTPIHNAGKRGCKNGYKPLFLAPLQVHGL